MKKIILFLILVVTLVFWSQFTFFVIQPIGAVPEGRTLLITRLNKTKFIDSADAMCERELNRVSLICRISFMGAVMEKSKIIARLPYSSALYNISTSDKTYEK